MKRRDFCWCFAEQPKFLYISFQRNYVLQTSLVIPYYLVDSLASHLPVMMGAGDVVDSGVDGGDGAPVGEVLPSKSPLPSATAALARFHTSQLSYSLKQLPRQESSHSSTILSFLKQRRDQKSAHFSTILCQLKQVLFQRTSLFSAILCHLKQLPHQKNENSQLSCVTWNNSLASTVHTSQLSCLTWSKCLTRTVHSSKLFCFNGNNCLTRTVHTANNTFTISFWLASKVTWKFPGFLDGNCEISTFNTKNS